MPWKREHAQERINKLLQSVPSVDTIDFSTELYPQLLNEVRSGSRTFTNIQRSLRNIQRTNSIIVDGVHIYARLLNYDQFRLEGQQETERGHKRGLNFLHLHYAASDRIIEDFGAIRIDYHGGRMHCVVVDPVDDEQARIAKAIELANRLIEFSVIADREIANGHYRASLKIGIDSGKCVAIKSGSGHEQEPLFLGSAANYAAKLVEGNNPGIYLSNRVRYILGLGKYTSITEERSFGIDAEVRQRAFTTASANHPELAEIFNTQTTSYNRLIAEWRSDLQDFREYAGGQSAFAFHEHTPPLSTIDFGELSPSRSIRMPLVSIFGDVSGYTNYINRAISVGEVGPAVRAIHVIRGELHNVLRDDYNSRKVRYIGDCIHGLIAIGKPDKIDVQQSSIEAVKCGAAMRSSFNVIKETLTDISELGLAIGIEAGTTPVSRIGRRGDRSVRVASSSATIISEAEQSQATGRQLAIGPKAFEQLPLHMQNAFDDRKLDGLDCDVYDKFFNGAPAQHKNSGENVRAHGLSTADSIIQPVRAYCAAQ